MAFRKTGHARTSEDAQGYEETDTIDTLNTSDTTEARTPMLIYDARGNGDGNTCPTITGDHQNRITDYTAICVGNGQANQLYAQPEVGALNTMHDQQAVMVIDNPIRRLTLLEAERCQMFPDGWTDIGDWTDERGKVHKTTDSNRFKAIGNSMAIPFWYWLLKRISDHCEEKTMGSLFSGIGAFDLCWEAINGEGSVRFSSEIEPFCVAVMKRHFGDEATGQKGDWQEYVKPQWG